MTVSDRTVTKAGFRLVIKSGTVSKQVRDQVVAGLTEVSKVYKQQVDKNLSLDDHTPADLRKLDYPYAVGKPENIPHDDRMVHEQTGRLRRSIRLTPPEEVTSRKFTAFVTTTDPAAAFLIYGTSRMRPRRFHEKAFEDIKDKFWEPLIKRLKGINTRIETFSSTKGNS